MAAYKQFTGSVLYIILLATFWQLTGSQVEKLQEFEELSSHTRSCSFSHCPGAGQTICCEGSSGGIGSKTIALDMLS